MQVLVGLSAYHAKQDIIQEKAKVSVKYVVLVNTVILLHQVNVWFVQQENILVQELLNVKYVQRAITVLKAVVHMFNVPQVQ